jgi:hypothetical protein
MACGAPRDGDVEHHDYKRECGSQSKEGYMPGPESITDFPGSNTEVWNDKSIKWYIGLWGQISIRDMHNDLSPLL